MTASTSNGAVVLSASGPQGDVTVTAAQKLQLHAESGAVEVTTTDSFSVQVSETDIANGGAVTLAAGASSDVHSSGGLLRLDAGDGTHVSSGVGGAVEINGGVGHGGAGGPIALSSGNGLSGAGGKIALTVGTGSSGTGGAVELTAGGFSDSHF